MRLKVLLSLIVLILLINAIPFAIKGDSVSESKLLLAAVFVLLLKTFIKDDNRTGT